MINGNTQPNKGYQEILDPHMTGAASNANSSNYDLQSIKNFILADERFSNQSPSPSTPETELTKVALFIISGESNSGGYALNSEAPTNEIGLRSEVKILNNTTLAFENLNIGVNNLLAHTGLSNGLTHGFELPIANAVRDSALNFSETFIVKTGQGGSRISEWVEGGQYFNTYKQRVQAALNLLKEQGKTPYIFLIYSQGINDALAAYSAESWKADTLAHLQKLRSKVGFCPILLTKFMNPYSGYNAKLDEIEQVNSLNIAISATDAALRDENHWSYNGFRTLFSRMIPHINRIAKEYAINQNRALFEHINMIPNTNNSSNSSNSGNQGNSSGSNSSGLLTWGNFVNARELNGYIECVGNNTPSGGRATQTINAQQPFSIIVDIPTTVSDSNATVVYLDENQADDFAWITGKVFLAGVYQYEGSLFTPIGGYAATPAGLAGSGDKIKIEKSGNDLVYSRSVNGGQSYNVITTATGVLTGKNTLYVKTLFAVAGAYKVKVSMN
ncbi:hypothetical protein GCM10011514_16880 [Emticicia aquatilis]|uniref:Sialate O-acetylesterase domain-containing protein n=1 Tax=Emticicia aquatilis TaxID=1537369 RepID=A0A916YPM8_9BACT|nr:sialate O-acetylesterase [Emticicia aquatilis]GGD53390.1 hypothetical protein GCM10011514_16880 [Emticicia aquatilis]